MNTNMVSWFEIPTTNIERAQKFYEEVFDIKIHLQDFGGVMMGFFPFVENRAGASGALVQYEESYIASKTKGVLIYFSSKDVSVELNRIERAGGKIVQNKTQISESIGYMGVFIDVEGNRIALHSRK